MNDVATPSRAFEEAVRAAAPAAKIQRDAPLARITTMRVGGSADLLVSVSAEDAITVTRLARAEGVPVTVLGGGSNVVIADAGIRGLTLRIHGGDIASEGSQAGRAAAGVTVNGLVRWLAGRGLAGLEAWAGTPGTVGGAICGNAHFQGRLISEYVRSVRLLGVAGDVIDVPARRWGLATTKSHPGLGRSGPVGVVRRDAGSHAGSVARCGSHLARVPQAHTAVAPVQCRLHLPESRRRRAAPRSVPRSAGALIDRAGLKGAQEGGAAVSALHANFIVVAPGSRAADVRALVDRCRTAVVDAYGVRLDEEIVYLGDWDHSRERER